MIAAVVNVPLFLICVFLLQTRFRPEMQEDSYYARYLETTRQVPNPVQELDAFRAEVSSTQVQTLDVVETIARQLAAVVDGLASVPSAQSVHKELTEARDAVALSERQLNSARRAAKWQTSQVQVNDLLPAYEEIRSRLAKASVTVTGTFGSSSDHPRPPSKFVLSFGQRVLVDLVQAVFESVSPFGLEYVRCLDDNTRRNYVYVGSYAYEKCPVASTSEIADVIRGSSAMDPIRLTFRNVSKIIPVDASNLWLRSTAARLRQTARGVEGPKH